ncbi:MAG: suppressor of fused domain protein [Akkermansiaceae bacterium]
MQSRTALQAVGKPRSNHPKHDGFTHPADKLETCPTFHPLREVAFLFDTTRNLFPLPTVAFLWIMDSMSEQSESGDPIIRHEARERDFEFATGDSENIDAISDHIEQHIGPVANVFHEIISDLIHIDIHIVEPTEERNFYTLVTSGMSDMPMAAPDELHACAYSELMICLPPDWPMGEEAWKNEDNYWPIRLLKMLARFPHEYQTWLWSRHTIPNGNPAVPYASNTGLVGTMVLPPLTASEAFYTLQISEEKIIHFHGLIPLYEEEMDLKLKKGAEALFDGFDQLGVSEILIPNRPSSIVKKRGWFPFGRK